MGSINGGITISGVIDGSSVLGEIAVINGPLLQYYDGASVKPDWAAKYATNPSSVPTLYPKMHDSATGEDLTGSVSLTRVTYNDTDITWGANGIATAPAIVANKLKKESYSYGGRNIECVKFIGNPANESTNPDDDRIAFYGTCVSSGGAITFSNVGTNIEIRRLESTDVFDLYISVPSAYDSYIKRNGETGQTIPTRRLATLVKNGEPVNAADMAGYVFEWADITNKTVNVLTNSSPGITISNTLGSFTDTITIDEAAVDSMMTLRCRVYEDNTKAKTVATGVTTVFDFSDELQVRWMVGNYPWSSGDPETEYVGDEDSSQQVVLRKNDKLRFRPVVFVRESGQAASAFSGATWTFSFDDNNGDEINPNTLDTPPTSTYAVLAYGDVVKQQSGALVKRPVHISCTTSNS
jgi:hypothetical protein